MPRKSSQVGILDDVGAVQMVLAVCDGQADFVGLRGPRYSIALDVSELPIAGNAVEQ